MKRYFLRTLQDALLVWMALAVGITATAVLYTALISVASLSKSTSLLIAFVTLTGLIILSSLSRVRSILLHLFMVVKSVLLHLLSVIAKPALVGRGRSHQNNWNYPSTTRKANEDPQNHKEGFLGKSFWGGVGAIATIATLIVAIITIPQAAPIRQDISHIFSGTPAATETPTATPSPVATPQVIAINQTMTCTDCSGGTIFSLNVRSAKIDPVNSQVTLLIEVQNNSTSTHYLGFNFLKLQDMQTGATTDGTDDGFSNFPITANQVILFSPTFQFVPVAGHAYSLSAELSSHYYFSPNTIKFR